MKPVHLPLWMGAAFAVLGLFAPDARGCTRVLWNTDPGLVIVGRNEDYITASHPTLVATPRGVQRWGTADSTRRPRSIRWVVRYGNVAIYENNRFPNDGMNEAGLTARTLFYLEGDPNQAVAPDTTRKELDEDHWVSYLLDNFASVAEAVDALRSRVYIVSVVGTKGSGYSYATPKHLALADATGDSAIIEVQRGRLEIFHGRDFKVLTNNPSYQDQLANAARYRDVSQDRLPAGWTGAERFVRSDYFLRHLPRPRKDDAPTAYGFMYSGLATAVMPAGLPAPAEDEEYVEKLVAELLDPTETYGGISTYWQSISDLTNRHYRFRSLIAPSDVFFHFEHYDFSEGQPVRVIKRIDRYAQEGWSGAVIPHLVEIDGDIYDQAIE